MERWQGVGVTPGELKPDTVVMVPVGQGSAIVNGGPCIIAWAIVRGPADDSDTAAYVDPKKRYWLDVYTGPGVYLPQMYAADEILGVPALGLNQQGAPPRPGFEPAPPTPAPS